jgi:hypothetical protein
MLIAPYALFRLTYDASLIAASWIVSMKPLRELKFPVPSKQFPVLAKKFPVPPT